MSNKLTDHDIASLYHQGAQEQPSKTLDAHILQLAKNQTPISPIQPMIKKRRLYQTWYAQLSTAASFLLVAVLYFEINPPHQETEQFEQQRINQQSGAQEIQSDQFISDPVQMKKNGQAMRLKQAKSQTMKAQSKMSRQSDIAPLENQILEVSDSLLSSKEITGEHTIERELSVIDIAFEEIERLLAKGESTQATFILNELITSNPELENALNNRYQALEKQLAP